jgi:hypothetical protein
MWWDFPDPCPLTSMNCYWVWITCNVCANHDVSGARTGNPLLIAQTRLHRPSKPDAPATSRQGFSMLRRIVAMLNLAYKSSKLLIKKERYVAQCNDGSQSVLPYMLCFKCR